MAFESFTWKNDKAGGTKVNATNLNGLEGRIGDAIEAVEGAVGEAEGAVASVNGKTGAVTGLEEVANKDITGTLGTSDTKYPSQKAVKTYVDAEKSARESAVSTRVRKTTIEESGVGTVYYDDEAEAWPARPTEYKRIAFVSLVKEPPEPEDLVDGDEVVEPKE